MRTFYQRHGKMKLFNTCLLLTWITLQNLGAESKSDWLYPRGNAAMSGTSSAILQTPLRLAWTSTLGNSSRKEGIIATPIIHDNKVYIGSQSGKFACLDLATGKPLWQVEKKSFFEGNATLSKDLVIAGCGDGFVYAWNRNDGSEKWKFETRGEVHAGAATWTNAQGEDRILIGSYDNFIYCLDAKTGNALWSYETANYINGAPAIEGHLAAFGCCDGQLYLIDLNTGKEVRTIDVGAYIGNNVALDQGQAFVTHYGNRVAAFALNEGQKLWEFNERDFPYFAAPAVDGDAVIAAGRDKRIRRLSRQDGSKLWEFRTRGNIDSSPVICSKNHVVFGSDDGNLYVLQLSDGKEIWRYEIGAGIKVAPALTDSYLVIGADDGVLYSFHLQPAQAEKP